MGYRFDNLRLEKGMYNEAGRSFTQVLEREDPSEQYKGTALEGLDAYQRQLKRFDIKVKGAGSDAVEKFFATSQSAVLFPEYIARSVRQGMEEANLLPHITAAVTRFDGMDYRSIASVPDDDQRALRWVEEGAAIPQALPFFQYIFYILWCGFWNIIFLIFPNSGLLYLFAKEVGSLTFGRALTTL